VIKSGTLLCCHCVYFSYVLSTQTRRGALSQDQQGLLAAAAAAGGGANLSLQEKQDEGTHLRRIREIVPPGKMAERARNGCVSISNKEIDLIFERFHDAETIKVALSLLPQIGPPNRKDKSTKTSYLTMAVLASILLMRIIVRKMNATTTSYPTMKARQRMIQAQIPQKRRSRKQIYFAAKLAHLIRKPVAEALVRKLKMMRLLRKSKVQ
jgi:hypothetical protein